MTGWKKLKALLCTATLLVSVAGCGQNVKNEDQAVDNGATETVDAVAADTETAQSATAYDLMRAVNTAQEEIIDDNYRTWYEVFVYSFFDSDGDGIGDLKGLNEKIDYINDGDPDTDTDLGCNGIWLMPVMPSTTYHKYDVIDYKAIDPEYGTLDDFSALVEACHQRGIDVIIDLVMNHTSSQNEWFLKATEYLKSLPDGQTPDASVCPYVDYYNFATEAKSGYVALEGTPYYYEAQFWSEMPDLNLANEAVRGEFENIIDFWLDLGVDGFRLDAAKEYYSGSVDANVEVLTWFNQMVKEKKEDAYIVAEVWNDMNTYAKYYASGMDSCFDFDFADSTGIIATALRDGKASYYGGSLERVQSSIAEYSESGIDAPFYTNHDMARGAGYYSGDHSEQQTKMAQAMNLLMSGSAFLYYGEELGMKGSGKDENKRAPMYWSEDADADGMCHGPLDMDTVKMKYGSAEEQQADGDSIYQFVKETIKLRNQYPAIARGTVTFEDTLSDDAVCVVKKTYQDDELVLVYNLSAEEQTVDVSSLTVNGISGTSLAVAGELLTGTDEVKYDQGVVTLPGYSVVVLK